MKKLIIATCFCFLAMLGANAQRGAFEQIPVKEVLENTTFKAVAYNFVYDIIFRDYRAAKNLINKKAMKSLGGDNLFKNLDNGTIHDISEMRRVIPLGYLPVIVGCDDANLTGYFGQDQPNPFEGCQAKSVSFNCVNDKGEAYNHEYGDYDTTARVILVHDKGKWTVIGFK